MDQWTSSKPRKENANQRYEEPRPGDFERHFWTVKSVGDLLLVLGHVLAAGNATQYSPAAAPACAMMGPMHDFAALGEFHVL